MSIPNFGGGGGGGGVESQNWWVRPVRLVLSPSYVRKAT